MRELEVFIPNLSYGHDFYRVANAIMADRSLLLTDKTEKEDLKNSSPPCIIYLEVIKRH